MKILVFAAVLQLVAGCLFAGYMLDKVDILMGQQTASLASYVDDRDVSTRLYVDQQVMDAYNQTQQERSWERESMHAWVARNIELRLSQQQGK